MHSEMKSLLGVIQLTDCYRRSAVMHPLLAHVAKNSTRFLSRSLSACRFDLRSQTLDVLH
jgi:hypothetical protein